MSAIPVIPNASTQSDRGVSASPPTIYWGVTSILQISAITLFASQYYVTGSVASAVANTVVPLPYIFALTLPMAQPLECGRALKTTAYTVTMAALASFAYQIHMGVSAAELLSHLPASMVFLKPILITATTYAMAHPFALTALAIGLIWKGVEEQDLRNIALDLALVPAFTLVTLAHPYLMTALTVVGVLMLQRIKLQLRNTAPITS